ncbi:hypothetical protein BKA70DRAFT_1409719 [Coprinopsis sp. MPI-PUGE-AT-0042]|nr:hypothetical protein BKA70DRAFT_1409719 [Coprinopsis sp. MPI-PUGE-AT-0042]
MSFLRNLPRLVLPNNERNHSSIWIWPATHPSFRFQEVLSCDDDRRFASVVLGSLRTSVECVGQGERFAACHIALVPVLVLVPAMPLTCFDEDSTLFMDCKKTKPPLNTVVRSTRRYESRPRSRVEGRRWGNMDVPPRWKDLVWVAAEFGLAKKSCVKRRRFHAMRLAFAPSAAFEETWMSLAWSMVHLDGTCPRRRSRWTQTGAKAKERGGKASFIPTSPGQGNWVGIVSQFWGEDGNRRWNSRMYQPSTDEHSSFKALADVTGRGGTSIPAHEKSPNRLTSVVKPKYERTEEDWTGCGPLTQEMGSTFLLLPIHPRLKNSFEANNYCECSATPSTATFTKSGNGLDLFDANITSLSPSSRQTRWKNSFEAHNRCGGLATSTLGVCSPATIKKRHSKTNPRQICEPIRIFNGVSTIDHALKREARGPVSIRQALRCFIQNLIELNQSVQRLTLFLCQKFVIGEGLAFSSTACSGSLKNTIYIVLMSLLAYTFCDCTLIQRKGRLARRFGQPSWLFFREVSKKSPPKCRTCTEAERERGRFACTMPIYGSIVMGSLGSANPCSHMPLRRTDFSFYFVAITNASSLSGHWTARNQENLSKGAGPINGIGTLHGFSRRPTYAWPYAQIVNRSMVLYGGPKRGNAGLKSSFDAKHHCTYSATLTRGGAQPNISGLLVAMYGRLLDSLRSIATALHKRQALLDVAQKRGWALMR